MESQRDRLIELMERLRAAIYEKEFSDPETAAFYRGRLEGMKDSFFLLFGNNTTMCKYVLNI